MGNAQRKRNGAPSAAGEREVTNRNRSNRISAECARQISNNRQSGACFLTRFTANEGEGEDEGASTSTSSGSAWRRILDKSRGHARTRRRRSYLKLPGFVGENAKWLSSCAAQLAREHAPRCVPLSPCFSRPARLLDALQHCVCCPLVCNDTQLWKVSDSFCALFCACNTPAQSMTDDCVATLPLPRWATASVAGSAPNRYSPILSTGSSVMRRSKSSSSVCELFSLSGKHTLLSACADISDNLVDSSVESPERAPALQLETHDYAELDPMLLRCPAANSTLAATADTECRTVQGCFSQPEASRIANNDASCIDKLPVHEFAAWFKDSVHVVQQQSADNLPFSQFLFNNLQLFSKADLRKLKTLNVETHKQVRAAFLQAERARETLCKSCNDEYMRFVDQREIELSQLIGQQKLEYQMHQSKKRANLKSVEKQLRQQAREQRHKEVCGNGLSDKGACFTGGTWQRNERESAGRGASRWLRCACYSECGPDAAAERQLVARLGEVKLDNERQLQELECKFLRDKRLLLVAQEERRLAHLECAVRRLSQLEAMQLRSFCQRRCELVTNRVKIEIDSIRRVRLAKRDALYRRQKSELKRAKAAAGCRRQEAGRSVLSLCDMRSMQCDFQAQHQADLQEFDDNTEKLLAEFETISSEKLRNLMDVRDLQFNHLRSIVDRKVDALRIQQADRLRLLHAQLENEAAEQQSCFATSQSSVPLIFNAQKVNWSTLTWKIKAKSRQADREKPQPCPTALSSSSGFASRDGSLHNKL